MSFFISLGNGEQYCGEASLWGWGSWPCPFYYTVAVDLGRSLGREVARFKPRILILTHDDKDHIGGWDEYKNASGLKYLKELWIPYEWVALIYSISFFNDSQTISSKSKICVTPVEKMGEPGQREHRRDDEVALRKAAETASSRIAKEPAIQHKLLDLIHEKIEKESKKENSESGNDKRRAKNDNSAAERAIKSIPSLVKIIRDTCELGCVKIRCYDYDQRYHHFTQKNQFTPAWIANASEVYVAQPKTSDLTNIVNYLYLSIQNQRALCPVLIDESSCSRVLVWSDSSGDWVSADDLNVCHSLLVSTAPHHGSTNVAHNAAWRALKPLINRSQIVMVLGGGEPSQKNVRPEYLQIPPSRRGCTRCRHGQVPSNISHSVVVWVGAHAEIIYGMCKQ